LNAAHIILLLVSPDFMASDYCYGIEMKRALERHEAKEARVIPVILRPTDWERALFGKLQAIPADRKPITRWPDRDEAFLRVAQDIRKVVDELNAKLAASSSSQQSVSSTTDPRIPQQGEQVSTSNKWPAVPEHTIIHTIPNSVFLFNQPLPDPGEFYGRVRERETLINRTRNGASTSIVGPRRVGKTWLMSYLRLVARKELGTRFLVGYLDVTTARCATVAGFTASALEALAVQKRTSNDAAEGLALLEQVVQELIARNQVPVLCIDEFEGFSDRQAFDLHFFTALRAMTQTGLSLVVASKSPLIDIVGEYGKTSGFFNVFEQRSIKPFSVKEAERFVQAKATQARFTEQERVQLLHYGQIAGEYWPLRLQLVGKMLLEDKNLAMREQDPDYYRPNDPSYWQEFEQRLEETYRGVVR
jgi:AAA domain-containing protein